MSPIGRVRASKLFLILTILFLALFLGIAVAGQGLDPRLIYRLALLNLCAAVGIYSLWGFSSQTLVSITLSIGTSVIGTILGDIPWLLLMLLLPGEIPWTALTIDLAVVMFILPVALYKLHGFFTKKLPPVRYLVLGHKEEIEPLLEQVVRSSPRMIRFVEYMNPNPARLRSSMLEPKRFDSILVTDSSLAKHVATLLADASTRGIPVEYLPDVVERILKKIPNSLVTAFPERYRDAFSRPRNELGFRILDLMIAVILLVILLPTALLSVLLILVVDGRPVFYSQDRHGRNGKKFRFIKFRTMLEGTGDATAGFTRSGKMLRVRHLNEIPQLFNVLVGHMSMVGPRPDITTTYESCLGTIPRYALRTSVRPGLTGIAQIYYEHIDSFDIEAFKERFAHDIYYVKNRSVVLYLQTLLLTVRSIVFRRGA